MTIPGEAQRLRLSGVHHVSAISAQIGRSHDFYTRVLGMRPVIKTVNQDDPSMYHLFFGDGAGTPGSDVTVFDIPHAARERRGNNSFALTTLRVAGESALSYWVRRFTELDVSNSGIIERDGRRVLDFEDREGTMLSLVDDGGAGEAFPWRESPVPAEAQVRGLGYVVLFVPSLEPTDRFLSGALGLKKDHSYSWSGGHEANVYLIGDGGAHAEVHVVVRQDIPRGRQGAGAVHHVALRVPEGQIMEDWVQRLNAARYMNSGIVDRHYFKSIYVREPNHALFELASDGPGFDVDGPIDGEKLSLPPFLEPRRGEIERSLRPLSASA